MKEQVDQEIHAENQENDFIDFIVGAGVVGGFLFGIFIIATVAKIMM